MPSLPLQIFLHFNTYYIPPYFLLSIVLLVYKGIVYPYPPTAYALEFISVFAFCGIESSRMFLGTRGNKTDQIASLGLFLGLSVASLFAFVYFFLWQTFSLLFDVILNALGLGFIVFELTIGLVHFIRQLR